MKPYISADIGGSHITSAAVDPQTRKLISGTHSEKKVDSSADADDILGKWASCISETISKAGGAEGIGIAMPGPFDYFNGVSLIKGVHKFDSLYGVNVAEALQRSLNADIPVRFINDAIAFAIGEAWAGEAKDFKKAVAITLGTGFGSAFLDDGLPILEGKTVPDKGFVYNLPYRDGIADDHFSTRWFVDTFKTVTGISVTGVKDIADLAKQGDTSALDIFREFGTRLGRFLYPLLSRFEAGILVIGGNIANAGDLFIPAIQNIFESENLPTEIKVSGLKEEAALLGAAHLIDNDYFQKIKPLLKLM
jgi:glucokinase